MKNIFVLFSTLLYSAFANNCYTPSDILNSDRLFSYKNNVYDVTGYKHPGGKSDLLKTVSIDASVFFNQSQYKFHIGSSNVKNDLEKMYVGKLQDNCTDFTTVKTTIIPETTITKSPTTTKTTKHKKTTTIIPETTITEFSTTPKTKKHKKTTAEILTTVPTIIPVTNSTTNIPNTTVEFITTNTPCTTNEKQNINNSFSNHFLKTDLKFTLVIFLIYILI